MVLRLSQAMSSEILASRSPQYRPAALTALVVFGALACGAVVYDPRCVPLALYGLYAILAHLLISFLAHEPALWYAAKLYPAGVVALVGTLATIVAIVLDYWLIGWLVNHHLVRAVVQESRWFQFAQRWFRKAPLVLISGSAFAPVPFYPVKIIAIASEYPLRRFMIALVIGRLPRFWLLAKVGGEVQPRNSTLGWIMVGLAVIGTWRIWRARWRRMLTLSNEENESK